VERTGKMDRQKSPRNEIKVSKMSYRIEDFENNPAWTRSLGKKLGKIHFRKYMNIKYAEEQKEQRN